VCVHVWYKSNRTESICIISHVCEQTTINFSAYNKFTTTNATLPCLSITSMLQCAACACCMLVLLCVFAAVTHVRIGLALTIETVYYIRVMSHCVSNCVRSRCSNYVRLIATDIDNKALQNKAYRTHTSSNYERICSLWTHTYSGCEMLQCTVQ
jgi:hypothetical protein